MSQSPAPETAQSSRSTSQSATAANTPQNGTTSTSNSTVNAPSPLDQLSPTDLRNKLEQSRKELRNHLDKKRKLDRDLAMLETSIYAFEGSYLSDSLFPPSATSNAASTAAAQFGNIIRGYDSYLKAPSAASGDRNKRVRGPEGVNERERMFSASSATYTKSVELRQAELAAQSGGGYGGFAASGGGGLGQVQTPGGGGGGGGVESASEEDSVTSSRRKRNRH